MESTQIYSRPVRMGGYVLLAVLSLVSIFPLVWMALNAFKPGDEILYFPSCRSMPPCRI